MKFELKDVLWSVVCIAFFVLAWNVKGCIGGGNTEGVGGTKTVRTVRVDTVKIKDLVVKYERVTQADAALIDSLQTNRVMVVNEKTTEITKVIPYLDSLGEKITMALELKSGDKILKLPTVLNVSDSTGKWINMRVLVDDEPIFIGAKIVSKIEKKEDILEGFWRKQTSVMYEQKNPYLNKIDIQYVVKKNTVKGNIVKGAALVAIGVIGGILISKQ